MHAESNKLYKTLIRIEWLLEFSHLIRIEIVSKLKQRHSAEHIISAVQVVLINARLGKHNICCSRYFMRNGVFDSGSVIESKNIAILINEMADWKQLKQRLNVTNSLKSVEFIYYCSYTKKKRGKNLFQKILRQ